MSILFYRRPDYRSPWNTPINASECLQYIERTRGSAYAIPEGLSFDEVINNKPLPPCSLNDFMDYLIYVERNAENLQFYLWYLDYVRRWDQVPAKDRVLSPEWQPEAAETLNLLMEKDRRSLARSSVRSPVQSNFEKSIADEFDGKGVKSDGSSFITASVSGRVSVVPSIAEINAQAGLKWQPFTIQPCRDECDQILRHYIAHASPRELNLSHKDRSHVIHALQHTTHPSALEPAFRVAEAALRGQSHPNFIRWSICNGNRPRVLFVRSLGIQGIVVGFVIAVVLTLSHVSRWYRIFAFVFWFIGFSTIVAAYKGLCLILHTAHSRNLRPWELADDISITSSSSDTDLKDDEASLRFERTSMNTFGPKNELERDRWEQAYQQRRLVRKVFEKSVWTQDKTLRLLQDRIVLGANVWSLIVTLPITVAFVALPRGNYF